MSTIAQYISEVHELVREASGSISNSMGNDAYQSFVRRALRRYSIDRPEIKTSQFVGDGGKYYPINATNFPGFLDGFSVIERVEAISPTLANEEKPNYIERDEFDRYNDGTTLFLFFKNHQPSSTDNIRVRYSILHTIEGLDTETVDTVPSVDSEAIVLWASSEAFGALAGKFAGTRDPSLRADVVNYRTKTRDYMDVSKAYRERYHEWIKKSQEPVTLIRDLDFGFGWANNQPFLTHRSGSRL